MLPEPLAARDYELYEVAAPYGYGQRAHIVQTIRQFDHNDADILRHGEEHLTQILCLHLQLGI